MYILPQICTLHLKCDAFRVPVVRVEISGLGVGSVTLLLRMLIRSCRHHGIIVAAACVVSVESAARQLLGCIRFLCCPTAATMYVWMDGWMDGCMYGWMYGWMDGWMGRWMYG